MTDDQDRSSDRGPREALAEIDGASIDMVNSTQAPNGFMIALVVLVATILTLINVAAWPVVLGLAALLAPLGLWYYLAKRKQPKSRIVLSHSGSYVGYVLVLMLVMQASRFWEVESWWEIAAKWILILAGCWFCVFRMCTAAIKNRIKDANEHPV